MNKIREWVCKARQELTTMEICTHDANNLNTIFENVILTNKENAAKTHTYVKKQTRKIKENVKKKYVLLLVKRESGRIGSLIFT